MHDMPTICSEREALQREAAKNLQALIKLTKQQIEALTANDQARLLALDKTLEKVFGEKERSFGALRQHTKEHGC
ncbi:MAG TPA: hypothetical protein DEQ47_14390 [Solibacterales bacterium]|nr:hypothetical protein [Bryobacterales bacterium]